MRIEIEDALSAPVGTESEPSQNSGALLWRWLLVAGAASLGSALIAAVAVWNLKPSPLATPQAVARLTVAVPADEELLGTYPGIAVSPDGAHLVYIARRRGVQQVFLRAIDRLESKPLVGTEGASAPFFSTDSQWVGFFAQGKLKKIPVSGGAAQIVCDARDALGGSWAPNEIIYFAPGNFSGLWRVSANGVRLSPLRSWNPKARSVMHGHRFCPEGRRSYSHLAPVRELMSGRSTYSGCRPVNGECWPRERQATTSRRVILSTSRDRPGRW